MSFSRDDELDLIGDAGGVPQGLPLPKASQAMCQPHPKCRLLCCHAAMLFPLLLLLFTFIY